jgi:hypothetical protein
MAALTLDTSISGKFANSYVDVAYCDDYWTTHYSETKADLWLGLSAAQKTSTLVQACNVLERFKFTEGGFLRPSDYFHSEFNRNTGLVVQMTFDRRPIKAGYLQKLQFPRSLDYTEEGTFYIPEPVKMAQCEQAVYLLSFDDSVLSNRLQGVTQDSLAVGTVRTAQNVASGGTALAPMAMEFLFPYFVRSTEIRRA